MLLFLCALYEFLHPWVFVSNLFCDPSPVAVLMMLLLIGYCRCNKAQLRMFWLVPEQNLVARFSK